MTDPAPWATVAFNQASASENKIHDDTVARRYGFRGGLVPGVTVYAYLAHPAVEAWGVAWLERGAGRVELRKPVYDGEKVRVEVDPAGDRYAGRVVNPDAELCARGEVSLPAQPTREPPRRRGDPSAPAPDAREPATRAGLERLRERGLGAFTARWTRGGYTRSAAELPSVLRAEGGGYADPAFVLGLANRILSVNVALGPWIHVESDAQAFGAVPPGAELTVEGRVIELFERGGHEFVDLDVAVFVDADRPALAARHRAIYRVRPPD